MVWHGVRLHAAPRRLDNRMLDDKWGQQGEEADHDEAANELTAGELPAHEDQQDDAQLEHQVGRREHEYHGGDKVGALLEEGFGHGAGSVGTGRGHHAEERGTADR